MPAGESLTVKGVNLLSPIVFASILFGAMVPYWFSALTMRSVGEAANTMVLEIARQFAESTGENSLGKVAGMDFEERQQYKAQLAKKGEKLVKPDYERCIAISTQASLREMIAPGCLVIVTPVLAGALFGVESVSGLLTGAIVSSVQLAISMSNTGGAWDNSKKYTEKGELNGYFPFRDGSPEFNEEQFRKAAEDVHGNGALKQKTNYGSTTKTDRTDIKEWLEDLKDKDKKRYEAIMAGEEGIPTTDGRLCIYAGKKSNVHAAAVVGDTVGDPLKDTSGPALNIVMKLMAIISVVFADFFMSTNHGNGLFCAGELPGGCF
jgi:inorganic pyrophosphatase